MNYLLSNNYKYNIENIDYPLYINNNFGSLPANSKVYQSRDDVPSNYYTIIQHNLHDKQNLSNVTSTNITSNNTKISTIDVSTFETTDNTYIWNLYHTIVGTLSFCTSDYQNITDSDYINITFEYYNDNVGVYASMDISQNLKKQFINTVNITYSKSINSILKEIRVYAISTFPVTLKRPIQQQNYGRIPQCYLYFISL